jgi:chromate transporter
VKTLRSVTEVSILFLKLGTIGFGGPAATIAIMEEEVVERRKWLSRQKFLDLVGMTNLIPGPNAVEMALHLGLMRAGWLGFLLAGVAFIFPAASISLVFAWMYVHLGTVANLGALFFGIRPVVIVVIVISVWRLGRNAVKSPSLLAIGILVVAAALLGVDEIAAMFAGAIMGMFWLRLSRKRRITSALLCLPGFCVSTGGVRAGLLSASAIGGVSAATGVSLWKLGLFFLKVGAVLYGSGYVLVAFLQDGLVRQHGWLSQNQLLDAIAVGQITPGPLLSTATFIGYLLLGSPGAIVATVAVFLPSFVFVPALNRVVPHVRRSLWAAAFLDSINVSATGLMAVVGVRLGQQTLTTWPAWTILAAAMAMSLRWKVPAALLVAGGALTGLLLIRWV